MMLIHLLIAKGHAYMFVYFTKTSTVVTCYIYNNEHIYSPVLLHCFICLVVLFLTLFLFEIKHEYGILN